MKENTVRWFVTSARDVLLGLNKAANSNWANTDLNVTYSANTPAAKPQAKPASKA